MPAPFRITGDPNGDWVIFLVGAIFCLYWLRALRLARHGARLFLRNLSIAVLVFFACQIVLSGMKVQSANANVIAGLLSAAVLYQRASARRSRYISKSVRRAVIARDLKDEQYDARKHHIDHVWPFSKGGSHTADNLRVIAKRKNLKKGAKRPRLRDMW